MGKKCEKKYEKDLKDWNDRIHLYRHEASSQFNKQLVYLSSGGLILTLGFVKDLVNISTANYKCLLLLTWIFFTLTLFLNLISHKSTMKSMDLELDDRCEDSDSQDHITNIMDKGSLLSLILAVLAFIIFVSINIL